jgi:hypothetical protein
MHAVASPYKLLYATPRVSLTMKYAQPVKNIPGCVIKEDKNTRSRLAPNNGVQHVYGCLKNTFALAAGCHVSAQIFVSFAQSS